jgi:hypothetical protein
MRLISENKYPSLISEAQSQWRTLKSNGVRSKVMARAISQVMAQAVKQYVTERVYPKNHRERKGANGKRKEKFNSKGKKPISQYLLGHRDPIGLEAFFLFFFTNKGQGGRLRQR